MEKVMAALDAHEKAEKMGIHPTPDNSLLEAGLLVKKAGRVRMTTEAYSLLRDWRRKKLAKELAQDAAFDAAQEAVIVRIEKGEPVTPEEMDKYFAPDSDWRSAAKILPRA